jgi:hypothetical protein
MPGPSLLPAISLVNLFGNQGIAKGSKRGVPDSLNGLRATMGGDLI